MFRHLYRHSWNYFPKNDWRFASLATDKQKKVAVVLSGSGVYDGTEIHEAAAVLSHLTRQGLEPVCYAPDICQFHVIDHLKGCAAENESRKVLIESARIARGNIRPLCELTECEADAVVFPGGFGAAKNLSNFVEKGENCEVEKDVARVLTAFHEAKKPIGLCCIAPVLAAKVICNVTITLGKEDDGCGKWPYGATLAQAKAMGANVECKDVDEISFDKKNLVVTTPAFMYAGQFHEIYDGIGQMICKIASLLKKC